MKPGLMRRFRSRFPWLHRRASTRSAVSWASVNPSGQFPPDDKILRKLSQDTLDAYLATTEPVHAASGSSEKLGVERHGPRPLDGRS